MKVLFLNGFGMKPGSDFETWFKESCPYEVISYDYMSKDPLDALQDLRKIEVDIIVGYSVGGFFAEKLNARKRILVCPGLGLSKRWLELLKLPGRWEEVNDEPSGNSEETIGYYGSNDSRITPDMAENFRKKYGEPEWINCRHKPPKEFWTELGKSI